MIYDQLIIQNIEINIYKHIRSLVREFGAFLCHIANWVATWGNCDERV